MDNRKTNTSWKNVGNWYQNIVDQKGHYYHEHVIIPGVLKMLNLSKSDSILDLGCGQGVLGRNIPQDIQYTGIDIASNLIGFAKNSDHNPNHKYEIGDVTKPLTIVKNDYSDVTIILALQNIEFPELVIGNAVKHLHTGGKLIIVVNHPCFRIPRQSSWGIDENNKMQYRKINRYLSPLKIPINMHPGKTNSPITWSFHHSISDYFKIFQQNHLYVDVFEEWSSDKESEGGAAKMENRARSEFPLFLAIRAVKI
jgi:SAM-dependent methyltransferase